MAADFPPERILEVWAPWVWDFLTSLGPVVANLPEGNLFVTSWWRSQRKNREERGSPVSQHLVGLAMDVDGDPALLATVLARGRAAGLHVVDERDGARPHLHIPHFRAGLLAEHGVDLRQV